MILYHGMFLNSARQKQQGAEGRITERVQTVSPSPQVLWKWHHEAVSWRVKVAVAQTEQTCIAERILRPLLYTFL